MLGIIGKILIDLAFIASIGAMIYFFKAARNPKDEKSGKIGKRLYLSIGIMGVIAAGILLYLILNHQFQYYYVYDYTSKNLQTRYLIAAFYSGQSGSFLLWINYTILVGWALLKLTDKEYRAPVMFFMSLSVFFLLSMILGIRFSAFHIGASPFRTLSEAMPNAPFIQSHPNFIPADGNGLNDLLKSPWILIHPPILFLGFSLMTVPFTYAMAALWRKKYQEWIKPALPWTLGANLCLITAIFLGGYWAYVTLSFGGFWAWDPVENASFVPWLIGVAGIHAMLIQRKKKTPQRASILLAILAYLAIVYESFLTRSGILGNSSVHSFVDLGLYNQLLIFMLVISLIALGMFFYRFKDIPKSHSDFNLLDRDFIVFTGSMIIALLGLVIIIGTSSPILGKFFVSNPTPPTKSFYNNWTMPLAIFAAFMTVIGQYVWWKKYDAETLSAALLGPLLTASVLTIITITVGHVVKIEYMVYLLAGYFALVGNSVMLYKLYKRNRRVLGGTTTHIGFAILLIGILSSNAYNKIMLDRNTQNYNNAVKAGKVIQKDGTQVIKPVDFFQLKKDDPTLIGNEIMATYEGMKVDNKLRPGEQVYTIKMQYDRGKGSIFYMHPVVYPMLTSSTDSKINWSVSPQVKPGFFHDIYMYIGGSSYVEYINKQVKKNNTEPVSDVVRSGAATSTPSDTSKVAGTQSFSFHRGDTKVLDDYTFTFENFEKAKVSEIPDSTIVAVHAIIHIKQNSTGETRKIKPLFAVIQQKGNKMSYAPPVNLKNWKFFVQFSNVVPMSDQITLTVSGLKGHGVIQEAHDNWVIVVAEKKPFISLVWLGIFIIMLGFSQAIFRRRREDMKRTQNKMTGTS